MTNKFLPLCLLAALLPSPLLAQTAPSPRKPLHEPLDCMKPFALREFAAVAFVYRHNPNIAEHVRLTKAAGFNVLMDTPVVLDEAHKAGLKVLLATIWYDVPKLEALGPKVLGHPAAIGCNLWDNATGIPGPTRNCANWLAEKYPHLISYLAENPNPGAQAKTPLKVLSTQNYAFGYNNTGPDNDKRRNFCNSLEGDRRSANRLNLTFWPIFASLAQSLSVGASEIRFQIFSSLAYGAQGNVSFAYSVRRPQWQPTAGVYLASAYANRYVVEVAGPHVIGLRSLGVYHTGGEDIPLGALAVGPGKLVAAMDERLLAGELVTEADFKSKANTPAYLMLVDKRTVRDDRSEAPERTVHVAFGPQATVVEVLERDLIDNPKATRQIWPALSVPVTGLKAGDGRLLRINPPDLASLLGPENAQAYNALAGRMKDLSTRAASGQLDSAAFEKDFAALQAASAKLDAPAAAPVLANLQAALKTLRRQAYSPVISAPAGVFPDSIEVALASPIKDVPIHFTLDGSAPTGASPRYAAPIRLDKSTTVRALAAGQEASRRFDKVAVTLAREIVVHFQPAGDPPAPGVLVDSGLPFGARDGGFAYGWNKDRSEGAKKRGRNSDPMKDSFVSFVPGAVWEFALANGEYLVTVGAGDPTMANAQATVIAEGTPILKDAAIGKGQFQEASQLVTVTDGRLTLTTHDRARADRLTRINYVRIKPK